MLEDLKTAVRALRHSPTFTAVALVVLALGIGAGTAIFSVVDAVVLRGLPFDEYDRIVAVLEYDPTGKTTFGSGSTTTQTFLDWRAQQQSLESLAAVGGTTMRTRSEGGEPGDARGQRVTSEFFNVLRVFPVMGRAFNANDERFGQHKVVILSDGFWRRRFGASPDVIGKTLELNEESWEIVGVMPRGFSYPVASEKPSEIYVPIPFRDDERVRGNSRNYSFTAIGRLKPGISARQASDDMFRVSEGLDKQYPKWSPGRRAKVIPLHEHLVGKVRLWMLMLLGAVTLVLLIACANVANLMLARATVRAREMGIRAALGASRWRLVRALLVEGLVLSVAGAALGVLLAYLGVRGIMAWLPAGLPRVASIGIDLRVLGAATAASLLTGLFFGIVPALHSSRPDLTAALKDSGRSTTAGAGSQFLRSSLVVVEVALAVILLVGAGLFIGSFAKLMRIDPGFDYQNVLTLNVGVKFEPGKWDEAAKRGAIYSQQLVDAVTAVPGVERVAVVAGGMPLTGSWSRSSVELPGKGELKGEGDDLDVRTVTPGYLELMKIPLKRGRTITAEDRSGGQAVMVVNEAAARKYWPGEDAIGKRIKVSKEEAVVVGIVGDIRALGPETAPRQEGYVPMAQDGMLGGNLVVRTSGDPMVVLPAVKAAVWSVNKDQRLTSDVVTLEGYMDRLIAQRRFNMALLALFGGLGLVIAAVGIYGVMAYVVAQRTNEIGVRMALGATRSNVVSMVLKRAVVLMGLGLAIGGASAWFLSARVKDFLFEIQPTDVSAFAAALAVLAFAGLAASAIPARRAASVDPMIALRQE
ncbi:MAG TPA: ABC transporter permease [Vicinamibacterales bacterium]